MGHLINPVSLRLGKTIFWQFSWSSFLKKNFKYLVLQDLQFILFLEWILRLNLFFSLRLVFSHFRLFRLEKKLIFFFYFIDLDWSLTEKKEKALKTKKNIYLDSDFISKKNEDLKLLESSLDHNLITKKNELQDNLYFFVIKLLVKISYLFKKKNNNKTNLYFNLKLLKQILVNINVNLDDLLLENNSLYSQSNLYFLRNKIKMCSIEELLMLRQLIILKKKKIIYRKDDSINSHKEEKELAIQNFFSKLVVNTFFSRLFKYRILKLFKFIFFKGYSFLTNKYKIHNKKKYNCYFYIRLHNKKSLRKTSNLIASSIVELVHYKKLGLKKAVDIIIEKLEFDTMIRGYKIAVSGRLTRNRRGIYVIFKDGNVPLNTLSLPIDYCAKTFITKFGVCGIKVWLNKRISGVTYKNIKSMLSSRSFITN